MVKRLATSPHDPLGITDSACKNQLVVVSVQYGPFNTYIAIRSTTIGKSRVAIDLINMHTSWRSNSDIASVTRQTHLPKTHPVLWAEIYHTIISSDSIGYPRTKASGESSTTKHRLLHASGPHPIPPPNDPKSNSDIPSVTRQTHLPKTHPVLWPEIYHTIISLDSIGYPRTKASGESSTTKHRLLHASGPHPIPPPNDPKSDPCVYECVVLSGRRYDVVLDYPGRRGLTISDAVSFAVWRWLSMMRCRLESIRFDENWTRCDVVLVAIRFGSSGNPAGLSGASDGHLSGTCAWLQPVFQEPGASRLIAVDSSIRSTTRFGTPSSDCTRSPDEISTIGFSTSNWPERNSGDDRRRAATAAALGEEKWAAVIRVRSRVL
ncbi:chromatin structure-remodeling complex protein SYD-like [Dorcoceras hygrometricum]|uniref:Chromatin structure-remodeling complex protein SYD-like n=1 Tax=Dorcoceras hygrometricum TaxID=472368 RepID=A0A2Z7C0K4_9LAMI|nr:chromatin structure-remodeling complex protein SYD-like [Dorcoceras hygrometricum]